MSYDPRWSEITLDFLIPRIRLQPGWYISLHEPASEPEPARDWMTHTAVVFHLECTDSKDGRKLTVVHGFPVDLPEQAEYGMGDWTEWIFERIMDVHRHELREFYKIGHIRPYPPEHGPHGDPYKAIPGRG